MNMIDLGPATQQLTGLITDIPDELLDRPTPCPEYSLGDLLDHIAGLSLAFAHAAEKTRSDDPDVQGPSGDASRLGDDWRTRIPTLLENLAQRWRDPEAWTGITHAGGLEIPGEIAGIVALNEVVVHGWDVARAAELPYQPDQASLEAAYSFVNQFSGPDMAEQRKHLFGPVVEVPDSAPLLDRLVGLAGRDPAWSPHPS